MKTLVLGDCASSGTNVLTEDIIGEKNATIQGSLTTNGNYVKDIMAWYLKQAKEKHIPIKDIKKIPYDAVTYLREQEVINSYWQYVNEPVVNMSKEGATGGGYYKRLLKYENEHTRPDIIVVTDYSLKHMWQVINNAGTQYFFEKIYKPEYPDFYTNPSLNAPEHIQYMAWLKARECYENKTTIKRNKRIMSWFLNYLDKNDYRYIKVKFYGGFEEFDNDYNCIDCLDLQSQYTTDAGEKVAIKIDMAPKIASRIQDKLTKKIFRV